MSEKRLYPKCAGMMKELVEKLEAKYGQEGYETQFLTFEEEEQKGGVFQLRPKSGGWQTVKDVTGMGTAATVTMKMVGQALEVEIGGGKWFDKAAVLGISMVVLWPLTITASIGALRILAFGLDDVSTTTASLLIPMSSRDGLLCV